MSCIFFLMCQFQKKNERRRIKINWKCINFNWRLIKTSAPVISLKDGSVSVIPHFSFIIIIWVLRARGIERNKLFRYSSTQYYVREEWRLEREMYWVIDMRLTQAINQYCPLSKRNLSSSHRQRRAMGIMCFTLFYHYRSFSKNIKKKYENVL